MPVKFVFNTPQLTASMLLHQTCNSITKCEEKGFAQIDLTPQQYAVLWCINFANGHITPTQIASWLERNLNSVTTIIDRMEKINLVKRVSGLKDRRSSNIVMTPKGEAYLKSGITQSMALTKQLMGKLSEEELQTFTYLLEKVRLEANKCWQKEKTLKEVVVGAWPAESQYFRDTMSTPQKVD